MCEEGQAGAQPSSVWILLAASSGPGQGEVVALSSVPLAAEMVKHLQAHDCLLLGLPQKGCGWRGQAAGGWEPPG